MTKLDSLFDLEGKPELNPKIGSTWSGQKIGLGLAAQWWDSHLIFVLKLF